MPEDGRDPSALSTHPGGRRSAGGAARHGRRRARRARAAGRAISRRSTACRSTIRRRKASCAGRPSMHPIMRIAFSAAARFPALQRPRGRAGHRQRPLAALFLLQGRQRAGPARRLDAQQAAADADRHPVDRDRRRRGRDRRPAARLRHRPRPGALRHDPPARRHLLFQPAERRARPRPAHRRAGRGDAQLPRPDAWPRRRRCGPIACEWCRAAAPRRRRSPRACPIPTSSSSGCWP